MSDHYRPDTIEYRGHLLTIVRDLAAQWQVNIKDQQSGDWLLSVKDSDKAKAIEAAKASVDANLAGAR